MYPEITIPVWNCCAAVVRQMVTEDGRAWYYEDAANWEELEDTAARGGTAARSTRPLRNSVAACVWPT